MWHPGCRTIFLTDALFCDALRFQILASAADADINPMMVQITIHFMALPPYCAILD
jgi:hypothetical protein